MKTDPRSFYMQLFFEAGPLVRELTVDEAEREFAVSLKEFGAEPVPFGYLNPEWEGLKKKMRSGDKIFEFRIEGVGRSHHGVKLIRKDKVLDAIVGEVKELTKQKAKPIAKKKQPKRTEAKKKPGPVRAKKKP